MSRGQITVWVMRFNDRSNLVLQWQDPVTGKRKSLSAGTPDEEEAERKRQELQENLNQGRLPQVQRSTDAEALVAVWLQGYEAGYSLRMKPPRDDLLALFCKALPTLERKEGAA